MIKEGYDLAHIPPGFNSLSLTVYSRGGIAQSVQRLATGWTNEGSEFESR
jgi:hypothetical protein